MNNQERKQVDDQTGDSDQSLVFFRQKNTNYLHKRECSRKREKIEE